MTVMGTCSKCGFAVADISRPCQNCHTLHPQPPLNTTPQTQNDEHPLNGCLFEKVASEAPMLTATPGAVPDIVDLRPFCSPVEDQGYTNSCCANAIVGALEYHQRKAGQPVTELSRLFVYYNGRRIGFREYMDLGMTLEHGMAAVLAYGVCKESLWPFYPMSVLMPPPEHAYEDAKYHEAVQYARTPRGPDLLSALAEGLPIVFGTYLPKSYYDQAEKTGEMPIDKSKPKLPESGHAMLIVGYNIPGKYWLIRNSWGTKFGDNGYFKLPFDTLESYSVPNDFWTIGKIEQNQKFNLTGPSMQAMRQKINIPASTSSTLAQEWTPNPNLLNGCLFESTPAASPTLTIQQLSLPEQVDLRALCSPVENQGKTNSCTAQAIVGALEYHQRKAGLAMTELSRMFVYYNARKISGNQNNHVGSFISHVMASVLAYGACEEGLWPYNEAQRLIEPPPAAYENAKNYEAVQYVRTPLGDTAFAALAAGLPVVFGTYLPQNFYAEAYFSGSMPITSSHAPPPSSGHAMLIVGYNLPGKYWLIRNSWGTQFGDNGYFKLPFSTMEAYSDPSHFWTIGAIEQAPGLVLSGLTMEKAQQQNLAEMRKGFQDSLTAEIEDAKQGIRSRLRGK